MNKFVGDTNFKELLADENIESALWRTFDPVIYKLAQTKIE